MKRREVLEIGVAAAALPAVLHAQRPHPEEVSELPDKADWKPQIFDDHQNQTVIALIDLIIPATDTPGAKAANVNRYIDLYLHDGPDVERTRFLEGLAWLDGYAIRAHSHSFLGCATADQIAILAAIDANQSPDLDPGHRFFRMIKSMTAGIYYNTRAGFEEMNKGGRVPSTFGCTHPEHA